jgi:hypothetical protein
VFDEVFVRVRVYVAGFEGCTDDGVEAAVNVSPGAAGAPEARSRQAPAAATVNSRRRRVNMDPFL